MDTARMLTFVCVVWTVLLYDVCSAARSGGSSSKTGSSNAEADSAGFVGGVDTSSPQFIILMTIFVMCVLALVIFLIIMCCKIRRYCCFKLPGFLPGSTDKIHIVDYVDGSASWSGPSAPPLKRPEPIVAVVTDSEKKSNILREILKKKNEQILRTTSQDSTVSLPPLISVPYTVPDRTDSFAHPPEPELSKNYSESPILLTKNRQAPRAKSQKSIVSLPPIYSLPYPVSAGTNSFAPPPEPKLSESDSVLESDSGSETDMFDDGTDSALSDSSQ